MHDFTKIIEVAKECQGKVIVPLAESPEALEAVKMAMDEGWLYGGILIGNLEKIKKIAEEINLDLSFFELIEMTDPLESANHAIVLLNQGKGNFLLKGLIDTKYYMKAILNKEHGLVPEGNLLSHLVLMQVPGYHKLLGISDVAINIYPTLEQKKQMVENAVRIFHKLGIKKPKVAIMAPVEKVNPKIESTVHAGELVQYYKDRDDMIVEGPFDLYIAVSKHAAEEKGVRGEVCGDADILIFPNLDSANPVYKVMNQFIPGNKCAAIVTGATIPAILPSRADSSETKKLSIALSAFLTAEKKVEVGN